MTSSAGVVIVTYNSAEVIGSCLKACGHLPTIVVDNASADATVAEVALYSGTRLLRNEENKGFAAAVNQGVAALDTEFVLLLNPDVQLKTPIHQLVEACEMPDVVMAGGQLVDGSGSVQAGFTIRRLPTPTSLIFEILGLNRLFPGNPVNRRYRCLDLDLTKPAEVEQPAGAFVLFRRSHWEEIGGFDVCFHPLWYEDVDFCRRTIDLGRKIRYVPQVTGLHQGGHSIAKLDWASREVYWYASLLRYASKHFGSSSFGAVSMAVIVGASLRAALETARRRDRAALATYAKVIRFAVRGLRDDWDGKRSGL